MKKSINDEQAKGILLFGGLGYLAILTYISSNFGDKGVNVAMATSAIFFFLWYKHDQKKQAKYEEKSQSMYKLDHLLNSNEVLITLNVDLTYFTKNKEHREKVLDALFADVPRYANKSLYVNFEKHIVKSKEIRATIESLNLVNSLHDEFLINFYNHKIDTEYRFTHQGLSEVIGAFYRHELSNNPDDALYLKTIHESLYP